MTVTPEVETEIRRLFFAEHWKVGTIARQLGVHHDVVRRVLGLLPPPEATDPRLQRLDPYRDFIAEQLTQYPRLRATRLFDMIRPRGYAGSVRAKRPRRSNANRVALSGGCFIARVNRSTRSAAHGGPRCAERVC